jgi:PTH1 family peptidyl-tRNA hydrolase
MKLIIGLGNPGEKYKNTRHNAGVVVIDKLQKINLPKGILVKKSSVFMNESGAFIKNLIGQYKIDPSDLYVIHDDLDIPLGSYKIQFGVGPKVHNGVNSIEREIGTKDFWRVRIGVDNRKNTGGPSFAKASEGKEYVLQDFTSEERKILDKTIRKLLIDLVTIFSKNTLK